MRHFVIACAVPFALLSPLAAAETASTSCKNGANVRKVEVVKGEGGDAACKVNYVKETEAPGSSQTLWSAKADTSFCDGKASDFIAKLKGMGWDCAQAQ